MNKVSEEYEKFLNWCEDRSLDYKWNKLLSKLSNDDTDFLEKQYKARLKADLEIILVELQSEIREYHEIGCNEDCNNCRMVTCIEPKDVIKDLDIIQQKINELKGTKDGNK